ncbi:hypothetical protein AB4090_01270 [Acidithiobacillus sp. IBUN Pt1247-S3]|uniref:hypothetical protein n=1 Tax=Acidithiobacillus sp. IBUN Pt1247-S3 TaxID=3166642 RepID=UPI0034E4398F
MERSLLHRLEEATVHAALDAGKSRVFLEYRAESGGPALSISLGIDLFQRLAEQHAGNDKAKQWLEARVREVADLSPGTVEHYLNFVIKQQLCVFPEEYRDSERLEVLPLCLLSNDSRSSFCATCVMCRQNHAGPPSETERKAG